MGPLWAHFVPDGQPVEVFLESETSRLVNHKPSFVPRSTEDPEEIVIDDSDDSKSPHHESQNKSLTNKKVCFKDLESSSLRPRSRSNHMIKTPEIVGDFQDRINKNLGIEFYEKYPWVSRKISQFHESERQSVISIMGYQAAQIEHLFPPWWHFLFPADEIDRKNWSIEVDGQVFVSTSKAVRNGRIQFISKESVLDLCPICNAVMNNKFLVYMKFIKWKEDYTGTDIVKWMTSNQKACYIHWRGREATSTVHRNPWNLEKQLTRRPIFNQSRPSRSSSPAPLGPSVLPQDLI